MTDLGFGFVDRRSVLVILFSLGISYLVFGNSIPINTSNAITAFLSLVVITGFIYAARSVLRLILAVLSTLLLIVVDFSRVLYNNIRANRSRDQHRSAIGEVKEVVVQDFLRGFLRPILRNRDWNFIQREGFHQPWYPGLYISSGLVPDVRFDPLLGILGIIDRAFLIAISIGITLEPISQRLQALGLLGVIVLLVVWILTGTFTLVIDDATHKAERDRQKELAETVSAMTSR